MTHVFSWDSMTLHIFHFHTFVNRISRRRMQVHHIPGMKNYSTSYVQNRHKTELRLGGCRISDRSRGHMVRGWGYHPDHGHATFGWQSLSTGCQTLPRRRRYLDRGREVEVGSGISGDAGNISGEAAAWSGGCQVPPLDP